MTYIEQYNQLKQVFDPSLDVIKIPGSKLLIHNVEFHSDMNWPMIPLTSEDEKISENLCFRYPVIAHEGGKSDHAVILLHGLNERSWHKHLVSAKFLAEQTGKAVVLFPLSFHINRGLPEWTDVHKMSVLLKQRLETYQNISNATIVNLALSERLTQHPQRFFISGLQSTHDLTSLMEMIRSGNHPLFIKGTGIDIFAYSISCMLLQSLMVSREGKIPTDTRIVLFAGGSLFSQIQGISRYIMDSVAFDRLKNYYLEIVSRKRQLTDDLQSWILESHYGRSFLAMLKPGIMKRERERAMSNYKDNLLILALRDDKVMPIEGIRSAAGEKFSHSENFREIHFSYPYTHENPFPVLNRKIDNEVDHAFLSVFDPVLKFFVR